MFIRTAANAFVNADTLRKIAIVHDEHSIRVFAWSKSAQPFPPEVLEIFEHAKLVQAELFLAELVERINTDTRQH